jgi:DNA polymerase elongation subunit (family B)
MLETASGSQLNSMMLRAYLQKGMSIPKATDIVELKGAISFAVPGIYSNCLKIDFAALYPSIMLQFEIYDQEKDPLKIFNLIVKYFAENRQKYKKLYKETGDINYDNLQNLAKTVANSCYGFLSANGLNFNSPENAAFITAKGREFLTFTIEKMTGKSVEYWKEVVEGKQK